MAVIKYKDSVNKEVKSINNLVIKGEGISYTKEEIDLMIAELFDYDEDTKTLNIKI